jgi:hypothetical protein
MGQKATKNSNPPKPRPYTPNLPVEHSPMADEFFIAESAYDLNLTLPPFPNDLPITVFELNEHRLTPHLPLNYTE